MHPTSKRARLRVSGGRPVITDGPFTEAKEVIAGFWMIQVKSKEEALEWAKRCPLPGGRHMGHLSDIRAGNRLPARAAAKIFKGLARLRGATSFRTE